MFLSNWIVFKIVLASLGLTDYPLASDLELVYDGANKLYLRGGMVKNASNVVLYKGETSYDMSVSGTDFLNSKTLFNNNAGERLATEGWFNRRIWSNGDGTRFVVLAQEYGSYGRAYVYEYSGGSWTQVKIYDKPTQSGNRMGLYCIMNRAGNRIWVDANPLLYFWERGSSEWNNTPTQSFNNNNNANRGLGMNEAGTILASCDAWYNNYYGQTIIRYLNSSGSWSSTTLNGSTQHHWGWESVLNKEGDILFQGSINNGVKIWHRTDAYGASWSHVHTPASDNSFVSNCKSIAISDTGYSFVSGNSDYDSSRGRIYFYSYDGNSNPVQLTFIDGENQNDQFGLGMSMSGDGTVSAVSAHTYPSNTNDGRVYVYVKSGGSWSLSQTLDKIQSGEMFGSGVALSNDGKTLFVGASRNDSGGTDAGCVYVFKKDIDGFFNYYITQPGTYRADLQICGIDYKTNEVEVTGSVTPENSFNETIVQTITSSDAAASDNFGYSVAIDGNYAIVGAFYEDPDGTTNAGAAYIYVRNTSTGAWFEQQKLTASDKAANDEFGYSVSLSGDYAIVGARRKNSYEGAAYIYTRDPTSGQWGSEYKIQASDKATGDRFGESVSISGDYANVGAPYGDGNLVDTGAIYIFTRSGTSWTQQAKLKASDAIVDGDALGYSVGISGNYAIAGAYRHVAETGAVYIFVKNGTSWSDHQKLTVSDGGRFGWSVAIDGDYAVCGSPTSNSNTGAAYIFKRDGVTNTWSEHQKLTAYDAAVNYSFGTSVAIDGDYVIVGESDYDTSTLTNSGAAYIFKRDGTSWIHHEKLTASDAASNDVFGRGVSLSGDYAIVGAFGENSSTGAAYIYELTPVAGLTFDNYNKFSLTNTPTYTSSKLVYYSNVYDVGALTDKIFIDKTGEYTSVTFDTSSNVAYFSNTSIQNVTVISDYIGEYGIANYSTYNGANSSGWTMDEWSLRPLRWNRGDRNNSLYVPVPASSSDPFAIDTLLYFYVQSLVANGFSSGGETFPFPTKNGVLWEVDMKNIELSCYNNNARVTGSSLESTYSTGNNSLFFELQCNSQNFGYNSNDAVYIYLFYNRTSSTGLIFDFRMDVRVKNNTVTTSTPSTFCLIQNVDLSNDTVLKYGWYAFDPIEGKPEFYLSIGGQTVSEKVSFSLNNAYRNFHDEAYGGCQVNRPQDPYNSNYNSHMGWPFRHFMGGDTRSGVGDNNTSEGRTGLKRGLIFDMMYFKYNNVFEKIPKIDFDTYNKLTFENITPTATTLKYGSNTYDLGTATDVYIANQGTYEAAITASDKFAFVSNVVSAIFPSLKPEGNVWDFTTTSSLTEPFYNSSLTKTGTITHNGTSYQTSTTMSYLGYTFPPITSNVLIQFDCNAATGRTSPFYFGGDIFQFYKASNDYWRFQGQGGNFSGLLRISSMTPTQGSFGTYTYFFEKTSSTEVTMYYYANGVKQSIYNESASGYTLSNGGIVFPISDINNIPTFSIGVHGHNDGNTSYFSNVYIEMEQLSGRVLTTNLIGNPDWFGYTASPSFTHDGYNKLSIQNITPISTSLRLGSNTYDIGTATDIYIEDSGTYESEITASDKFVLASNTTGNLGTYLTLHDNVAISHTTGGGDTTVTVNNIKGNMTYKIYFNKQWTDSHASYKTRFGLKIKDSSDVVIRDMNQFADYLNSPRDGLLLYDAGGSFNEGAMTIADGFVTDGSAGSVTVEIDGGTYGSTSSPFTLADSFYVVLTMSTSDVITGKFFVGDTEVVTYFLTRRNGNTGTIGETGNKFEFRFFDTATISGVNMTVEEYNPAPKLDFDTYNKLSISGITPTSTTLKYGSNTYDIGSITNIYIKDTGTYEIETKDANTFALASNVIGSVASPPSSTVNAGNFTLAFRHGTGTTDTSSNNCTLYSDMTTGDYDWGTVNSVTSTSTETTYNVTFSQMNNINYLVLAGGGGGGNDYPEGGGGGGGMLDGTETSIPGNTYDIVVGNGGTRRVNGTNSSFHTFTAVGGGAGLSGVGADGGSGGGGRDNSAGGSGVAGPPRQGYNGGTGYIIDYGSGGGGGGAGGNGGNAGNHVGGTGGTGRVWSFNNVRYGGGGGGGTRNSAGGSGGAGGGGNGGQRTADGSNGTNYLGGGGGCKANGGSGTVILNFDATQSSTPPQYFTFDTYNKLSIENITPTASTLRFDSNTYDIGTATNIYVEDTGTYEIEAKTSNDFIFASNVVSGTLKTIEPKLSECHSASFALTYDGKVYSYGQSAQYQTGLGTTTDISYPTLLSTLPSIKKLHERSPACQNGACISSDGRIFMWGDNTWYTVAGTTNTNHIQTPSDRTTYFGDQTLSSNTVTSICYSRSVGASLTETGNVWTWGGSVSGRLQLGNGSTATSLIQANPGQITFGGVTDNITRLAGGHDHHIALDTDGDVWFWGQIWASGGGLDYPASMGTAESVPQEIMTGNNIVGVSSTFFTLYAWQSDGTYYALGQDTNGQIGDGTATSGGHATWQKIDYFSANNITINEIYGGAYFVFADTSDGYYCWGSGGHGAFGNGGTGNLTSPTKWTNVSHIKVFSAGSYQCPRAITEDGKYYAWGNGGNYKRGDNTTGDISYPKYIDTLPNILAPSFEFDGYDKVLVNKPYVQGQIVKFSKTTQTWPRQILITDVRIKDKDGNILPIEYIYFPLGDGSHYQNLEYIRPSDSLFSAVTDGSYSQVDCQSSGCAFRNTPQEDRLFYAPESVYNSYPIGTEWMHVKAASGSIAQVQVIWDRQMYIQPTRLDADGMTYDIPQGNQSTQGGQDATYTLTGSYTSEKSSKYTKDAHTYDANQAQIITVSDPGTYNAQIKDPENFTLTSANVSNTSTTGLYTWAFHHGNFDNAYGDGDILTARDNGRFYADTPSYTGDIGTISASLGVPGASTQYPNGGWLTSSTSTQYPSINNNGFITQFTNYYNGVNSENYKILDNDDTTATYAPNDQGCAFDYYNNIEKVYIEKVYVDFGTSQPESETIFLLEYANDVSTVTSSTSINSRDSSILKVINSRNVWEITLNKVLHKFRIDCYNNGNNKMGCSPYNMYWTAYTLGEDDGTIYTFTPASTLTANVLMVAGGGGGGVVSGSGGGAGGLVYKQNESISTGAKTIVVGNGGYRINTGVSDRSGVPGKDTIFLGYTAIGGGAGSSTSSSVHSGGSGGAGTGASSSDALQPTSTTGGFGNQGGTNDSDRAGGGGGGAGGAGENGNRSVTGGNGGIGKNYGNVFGTNYGENGWFAGGGGGGSNNANHPGVPPGFGGKGGGGNGNSYTNEPIHGKSHSGGGGGGGGWSGSNSNYFECSGGSGIVLLQTNVATPNVNSEVKVPKTDGFLVYNDNLDSVSRGPIPGGSYNSNTIKTVKLPNGSEGPVYYSASGYTYFGVQQNNTIQGDGSFQTVESVFMPISTGYYTHIASLMYSDSNLMTLGIDGNNKLNIQHNNNVSHNGVTTLTTSDYVMEHGKWYHLVLTTDYLGNAKAYVNGYLVASERWSSMNPDKSTAMFYRIGVDNHPTRTFLTSTSRCYYSELNKKEIMQLAESVGLGPKLEYDGLNAINVVNTEPGSEITIYESNVNDTSNLYVVSCNESSYLLSNAGTYYAQIKGTDTFTITKPLTVTDDHFPLYQYPPIDGTTSSLTESASADTWSTWTISGATNGNGSYKAKTTHATDGTNYCAYRAFNNDIDDSVGQLVSTTMVNFGITLELPSAKTIRKYIMYPVDHSLSSGALPGSSTDPTFQAGTIDDYSRPNSWILKGSNDGTNWTDLDTVTNQPPSIYGDVHSIDSPASYLYYQLFVVNTVNTSSTRLRLGEWQLWGDA